MRKTISSVVAVLALVALGGTAVFAADVAEEYNQAMAAYFQVSPEVVAELMETGISVDEAPVALFLSQKTGRKATAFAKQRKQGGSWAEIGKVRGVQTRDYVYIDDAVEIMAQAGFEWLVLSQGAQYRITHSPSA